MENNYSKLCEVLKKDDRFVDANGNLLKNKIQESANAMDADLLKILLEDDFTKGLFFADVNGVQVFDKIDFAWIVNSKSFLPDSYTKFTQNIMLVDEYDNPLKKNTDVVLQFPNKDCLIEMDSTKEDEERNEVFLNERLMKNEIDILLSPKLFAHAKEYTSSGIVDSKKYNPKSNLVIKGNNLLVLKSLSARYAGRIKCMYWDILYNTNNDIVPYNDSFKHSSWLVMMKNRLEVAKELLTPDGVIIIECDKNEDAYLKVLCDEIFGREKFVNSVTLQSSTPSGQKLSHRDKTILKTKDTLLIYKRGNDLKINPQYCESDNLTNFNGWMEKTKEGIKLRTLKDVLVENNIIQKSDKIGELKMSSNPAFEKFVIDNKDKIYRKQPSLPEKIKQASKKEPKKIFTYTGAGGEVYYAQNGYRFAFLSSNVRVIKGKEKVTQLVCDIWTDISFHGTQYEGVADLPNGKKPERLLQRIINMFMTPGDIILDAYFGTGTTGAVAMKMGMNFIGIEQLDEHYKKSLDRLQDVIAGDLTGISQEVGWSGGGAFTSFELASNSENFIKKINNADTNDKLDALYEELQNSGNLLYRVDVNAMKAKHIEFASLSIEDKKKILIEIIDKNTLYINYSDIGNSDYEISPDDARFTESFYEGERK